jgi:type IV secretory pathway VirJ component
VTPETRKTTSTFGLFLNRQREANERRQGSQATAPDPECSFSSHHKAVALKVPQVPPIFSDQRAVMISSAVQRSRSMIESELTDKYTFRVVRSESSQKAIADAESRKEDILRKAIEKKQKIVDEVTSAREKAEKDAEEERKASKTPKTQKAAWLKVSGNLMANFFKKSFVRQAVETRIKREEAGQDPENSN